VIVHADRPALVEEARTLFGEYAAGLGVDLSFQHFEEERRGLPGDYAPPRGVLLLAIEPEGTLGCAGLRPVDAETAEMKRLYLRPAARGRGLGRALAEAILSEAGRLGYRRIRLDTLPGMQSAQSLYRALGFRVIPAYTFNPIPGTLFMERDL
jgi:ribosomal protein S18 acetylase RimI-like enzyme